MSLGSQLRDARLAVGMTITEAAEQSGFSASYISQVERDLANPSIGAVNRIAAALGVRMSAFFTNGQESDLPAEPPPAPERTVTGVVRDGHRKGITYPGSNVIFELLCPDLQHALEVLKSRAPAGSEMGRPTTAHAGEECAYVIHGTMELTVGEESYTLNAGDSIYFDSGKAHYWRNIGDGELEAMWIITPPHF
jgi:transcriptional regulator with XRE-family HTH domain